MITQIIEIQPVLVPRFRHALDFVSSRDINEQPTFQTVLPQIIHELTLKIETQSPTSYDSFRNYKTSFSFQFMYRSNLSLVEYSNISEMFHLTRTPRERYNFTQLSTPHYVNIWPMSLIIISWPYHLMNPILNTYHFTI